MHLRKALKFLHSLASCGLSGALAGYMILLVQAPQATAADYAALRGAIAALSHYLLAPSLALALFTGLVAMAVHQPFLGLRWVWAKALMGIGLFEGSLSLIGAKADHAAVLARRIASGEAEPEVMDAVIAHEWQTLAILTALCVANILLGVWRPGLRLNRRAAGRGAGK